MKSKFLFFSLFVMSLILASAMASANLVMYNPSNASISSLNQNLNTTGTFIIGNTNATANITGITCSVTSSSFSTTGTDCSTVIPSGNLTSLANSSTLTYWITVPQYTPAGNYTATITASGTLGGAATTDPKTVTITVNPSPVLSLTWVTEPSSVYQRENATAIINVTNTGNVALSVNLTARLANSSVNYTTFSLNPGQSNYTNLTLEASTRTPIGDNVFLVTATGYGSGLSAAFTREKTIEIKYGYCSANSTDYPIYIEEIIGKADIEDESFKPLDVIKLKVKARNSDSETRRVNVDAVLVKNSEISGTKDEDSQRLSSGTSKTFYLNITIPSDVSRGYYYIFIKAYNDDKSSSCEQEKIRIYVDREDNEILLRDVEILTSPVECSQVLEIRGSLVNLGTEYEDSIMLNYSDDLGFKDSISYSNVDSGESNDFLFTITIPKNATEKLYRLKLTSFYDYDSSDERYLMSWGESYSYIVAGNCFKEFRNASLSALTQTAFVGKDSDITIALTNTGNVQEIYTINASSNDLIIRSVTPSTISLPANSTTSIILKVAAKEGIAEGAHSLNIGISYSGKSETKTVQLNVQQASVISGWYSIAKEKLRNVSWIIVINVILVIGIIILVVKLFTKPAEKAAPTVSEVYKSNIKKNFK